MSEAEFRKLRHELLAARPIEIFRLIVASLLLAASLGSIYALSRRLVAPDWLGAAGLHSLLAVVVLALLARRGALGPLLGRGPGWAYLPAGLVLVGVALLATASRLGIPGAVSGEAAGPLAWIVWVPLVEEVVFRVGIGGAFRRLGPPLWAGWFSALVFALAHGGPTPARWVAGEVGLPLGPFLLALAAEWLYQKTGKLWPIVSLHAACNATPIVFGALDDRWLDWLGFLYR